MKDNKFKLILFLFLLVNATWLYYYVREIDYSNTVTEKLTSYIDKDNRQTSSIRILQLKNADMEREARSIRAKYELEQMKPAKVVYLDRAVYVTSDSLVLKTDIRYVGNDTLPTYASHDSTRWAMFDIKAGPDSTHVEYAITNEFITWHQKSGKWYQPPVYDIYTINLNPHTRIKERQTYQVKPKPAYRLIWMGAGFIIGLALP